MFRLVVILVALLALSGCGAAESSQVDEGDAQVVQSLKDNGSDLSKPHPIDFYFYFRDRMSAEKLRDELTGPGWKLDVHQTPDSSDWTVIASTVMVPDLQAISELTVKFNALSSELGGEYDGWEAAVTK